MSEIKIKGFHIRFLGDPSVGIFDSAWELKNDFYFENQEDLNNFRKNIQFLFENYCDKVYVETFEERENLNNEEIQQHYNEHPVRYLILNKDYGCEIFLLTGRTGVYSDDVGNAIHFELPHYINENSSDVIKSTDPKFKEILLKIAGKLEKEIDDLEYKLGNAQRSLNKINEELKYGK